MTVDELKSMPKGQFIVMKTGTHPMISPLKLYFKWGIRFEKPFILPERGTGKAVYMERDALFQAVSEKYPQHIELLRSFRNFPLNLKNSRI